jgi:AcrR family transcriptional regulator
MAAVLDVARAQFVLNGYRATTMDAIAAAAGVSKRTLYFWHADKAALFLACTLEGSRQLPQPEPDPRHDIGEGLKDYAAKLIARLSTEENYGMAQLLAREGRDFPELAAAVRHGHDAFLVQPLAEFLKLHGFEAARAHRAAHLFVAMALAEVDRAILLAQPIPTPQEITAHADFVTNIFLFGCLGRQ